MIEMLRVIQSQIIPEKRYFRVRITRMMNDMVIQHESNVPAIHYLHWFGAKYDKFLFGKNTDLDHVLLQGDLLYKSLNTYDML